jgi:hypothetical protein
MGVHGGDIKTDPNKRSFIYLHSTLTLVASVAQDGDVGFLHKRRALEAEFVRLPYIEQTGIRAGDYFISPRLETWENLSDRCVLRTRGWILQESILSPRKLLFGKDQMHWECQEHAWDENDTLFVHNPFNNSRPMDLPKLLTDMTQSYKSIFNQYNSWYLLVSKYSRRHLTFKEDKFPAIQGLASLIQRYLGCHYAAGLWEEDLPYGLLWSSHGQTSTHASSSRAPTWSWASLDSPIEYTLERRGVSIIEISDIKFNQEESDIEHSGRTIRGTIVLTGLLQAVRIGIGPMQINYFTIFNHPVMDMAGNIVGEAIIDTIEMMNTLREKELFGLLVLRSALNPRIATSLLLRKREESSTFSRVGIFSNDGMLDFPSVDLYETSSKERVTLI